MTRGTPLPADLRSAIAVLVEELARGNYELLETDGRAGRVRAEGLAFAVRRYGRTLLPLPVDAAWSPIHTYPVNGRPNVLAIDVPMFTQEEGQSDLTLSLTATREGDRYRLEIDDLHVL